MACLNCWRYRCRHHPEDDHHLACRAHDHVRAHLCALLVRPDRHPDRQARARDAGHLLVAYQVAHSGQRSDPLPGLWVAVSLVAPLGALQPHHPLALHRGGQDEAHAQPLYQSHPSGHPLERRRLGLARHRLRVCRARLEPHLDRQDAHLQSLRLQSTRLVRTQLGEQKPLACPSDLLVYCHAVQHGRHGYHFDQVCQNLAAKRCHETRVGAVRASARHPTHHRHAISPLESLALTQSLDQALPSDRAATWWAKQCHQSVCESNDSPLTRALRTCGELRDYGLRSVSRGTSDYCPHRQ